MSSAIDVDTLLDLAAIKELATLSPTEVSKLIPLWGPMRMSGPNSLYKTLFLQNHHLKQYPALRDFGATDSQHPKPLIGDLMVPLLSVLKLSRTEFRSISQAVHVLETDVWNLANVSKLYRHALFCKLLEISVEKYISLPLFDDEATGVLQSPRWTLSFVKRWKALRDSGFPNEVLLDVFKTTDAAGLQITERSINLTASILIALRTSTRTQPLLVASDTQADIDLSDLSKICNSVFDSATSEKIVALLSEHGLSLSAVDQM